MGANDDPTLVSRAIVLWTGWGRTWSPREDDESVADEFGPDAPDVLAAVRVLKSEFDESDAAVWASDDAMVEQAQDQFRVRHPEIEESAVRALGWCYSFRHK